MMIFASEYPHRPIQLQIGSWPNIGAILANVDVDCSAVVFDGSKVWASTRALISLNLRMNTVNEDAWEIRGSPHYEYRLFKYSARGFVVNDKYLDRSKINPKIFVIRTFPSSEIFSMTGSLLLLQFENNTAASKEYISLNGRIYNGLADIPYGPAINFNSMKLKIQQEGYTPDDGYGSGEHGYNIVEKDPVSGDLKPDYYVGLSEERRRSGREDKPLWLIENLVYGDGLEKDIDSILKEPVQMDDE